MQGISSYDASSSYETPHDIALSAVEQGAQTNADGSKTLF